MKDFVRCSAAALLACASASAQPIFQLIPYPSQAGNGTPWARSALDQSGAAGAHVGNATQGSIVILWRPTSGFFYWSTSGTMVSEAMSANGQVVAGWFVDGSFNRPARWTLAGGIEELSGGNRGGRCLDSSADGSVLVGYGTFTGVGFKPGRWLNGVFGELTLPPGHSTGICTAVSADGAVIAAGLSGETTPAVWTQATGLVPLPLPVGATFGKAQAVSDDGTVIAGVANAGVGMSLAPVKWLGPAWTPVVLDLPTFDLNPSVTPAIRDASADGSIILGELYLFYPEPFFINTTLSGIWRDGHPAQSIPEFLSAAGMPVEFLTLYGASISPDGRAFVGLNRTGTDFNPMYAPWFARLPAPSCPGDADGDGTVTFADITNVLANFNAACP